MFNIKYIKGDATLPQGEGIKIICHICNNVGAWGAGFVMALSKKWHEPETYYRSMIEYKLGDVEFVSVEKEIFVANMIAQNDIQSNLSEDAKPPIRYYAVAEALYKANEFAKEHNGSLHMPRIGCGLAGGDWNKIEDMLRRITTVPVTIYDLP